MDPLVLGCREILLPRTALLFYSARVAAVTHRVIRSCHIFFFLAGKGDTLNILLYTHKYNVKEGSVTKTHPHKHLNTHIKHTPSHANTIKVAKDKNVTKKQVTSSGRKTGGL